MALSGLVIVTGLIQTVVFIFLDALLLMLTAIIFKLKDRSYVTALKVSAILLAIMWVIGLILSAAFGITAMTSTLNLQNLGAAIGKILGMGLITLAISIVLGIFFVKKFYDQEWGKGALIWLVWRVFAFIAHLIIGGILGIIFVAIGLGTAAAGGALG